MMPEMMFAWFLYQVVSSFAAAAAQRTLLSVPYIMQSTERQTNRSLWGDKITPFRSHTHTRTQSPNTNGLLDLDKHFREAAQAGSDPQGSHTTHYISAYISVFANRAVCVYVCVCPETEM